MTLPAKGYRAAPNTSRSRTDYPQVQRHRHGMRVHNRRTRKGTTVPPRHRLRGRAATGAGAAVDASPVIVMTGAHPLARTLVTDAAVAARRRDTRRYIEFCGTAVLAASPTTSGAGTARRVRLCAGTGSRRHQQG